MIQSLERVIYINLDERTDRREHMEKMLEQCPTAAERFSAIRLTHNPVKPGVKVHGRVSAARAAASIWASHVGVLNLFLLSEKDGLFLTLEDDVSVHPSLWPTLGEKLARLPDDWRMVMFTPRYRLREAVAGGGRFVAPPLGTEPTALADFLKDYFITGAHFCLFRNKDAVKSILDELNATEEIMDVDIRFSRMAGVYGIGDRGVKCGGFGSDHN